MELMDFKGVSSRNIAAPSQAEQMVAADIVGADLLSEIALLEFQWEVLGSAVQMRCVCAAVRMGSAVVPVGAVCVCLGVGLGFGVLWLLTGAPLLSGQLGADKQTGAVSAGTGFLVAGVGVESDERWGAAGALPDPVLKWD